MSRPRDWYPLAGSDPTPGDVEEIQRLAKQMGETAAAIRDASRALNTIHESATVWEGEAGREFKTKTRETADTISKAHDRYAEVSQTLWRYSWALDDVQEDADALLAQVRCAQDDADSARQKAAVADPETQEQCDSVARTADEHLQTLKDELPPIQQAWDDIGDTAANEIHDIVENDDLKDSRWDDFKGFVADVTDIMGKLSAVLGVIALICTIVPGLQPFAALFGALALLTGVLSLAGNAFLYANGMATLGDVIWDIVGVASFGAGRAFSIAARSSARAARGLAKPAFIRSLRAGGMSSRQAKIAARSAGITGGGAVNKSLARAFQRGEVSWMPKFKDFTTAFKKPFSDIGRFDVDLPDSVRSLDSVRVALRNSNIASGLSYGTGDVVGAIGDGDGLAGIAEDTFSIDVPGLGSDPTPVER